MDVLPPCLCRFSNVLAPTSWLYNNNQIKSQLKTKRNNNNNNKEPQERQSMQSKLGYTTRFIKLEY